MIKVLCILGTRPEVIKMAPVIRELGKAADEFTCKVCVTAQHRQMLDQILPFFNIKPDYDLDIMQPDQSLSLITAGVTKQLDPVMNVEKPDWVLVQGDTTTGMSASLIAYYHRVRIGHIEAGLRTGDKYNPFPEEINRRIMDIICDLRFAPTDLTKVNLLREGIAKESVVVTGNTVIDALLETIKQPFDFNQGQLTSIPWGRRIILVTAHRRESFGRQLENICSALLQIAQLYRDSVQIVYPVHLNPHVHAPVRSILGDVPNITLLDPLDYLSFAHLMQRSYLLLTDSGGLQEEAPALDKPVLVLRKTTERPEAVEAGTSRIVGTEPATIVQAVSELLRSKQEYEQMARAENPYGDGKASQRICQALREWREVTT